MNGHSDSSLDLITISCVYLGVLVEVSPVWGAFGASKWGVRKSRTINHGVVNIPCIRNLKTTRPIWDGFYGAPIPLGLFWQFFPVLQTSRTQVTMRTVDRVESITWQTMLSVFLAGSLVGFFVKRQPPRLL
jgi:hypothetical protein